MPETVYFSVLDQKPSPPADTRRSRRRSLAAPDRNGSCFYCSCPVYPRGSEGALAHPEQVSTNDHYTPFAIGQGRHAVRIVTACARCNGIKASTPPHVFQWFVAHTDMRDGKARLRAKYNHFCYLLMAAGLRAAIADARSRHAREAPKPAYLDTRGRYTKKDLRKGKR